MQAVKKKGASLRKKAPQKPLVYQFMDAVVRNRAEILKTGSAAACTLAGIFFLAFHTENQVKKGNAADHAAGLIAKSIAGGKDKLADDTGIIALATGSERTYVVDTPGQLIGLKVSVDKMDWVPEACKESTFGQIIGPNESYNIRAAVDGQSDPYEAVACSRTDAAAMMMMTWMVQP
ncbi:MAG: hypothetical protein OXT65_06495 [Alphaproteobacteria bacterium]|nr:hypothetical protein [Alphaproteobacteria bacterium]